jgi:hypothetical protein
MQKRSIFGFSAGVVAGAFALGALVMPTTASASVDTSKGFPCISAAPLNFATGGSYGAAKKGPGFVASAGTCTYTSSVTKKTFLIARAPLGKSKLKTDAKLDIPKDHFKTVSSDWKTALFGTGKVVVLFVDQNNTAYEFLDNSGKATLTQLKALAKVVIPA